jgi:hypothetical protein
MPVQKLSPFLNQLADGQPARTVASMREMISRTDREPNTMPELIDKLASQYDLKGFALKLNSIVPAEDRGSHPDLRVSQAALDGIPSPSEAVSRPSATPEARKATTNELRTSTKKEL